MSMEIKGVGGQQQSAPSAVKVDSQDKTVYASIYNMLISDKSDSNDNMILDAKDFKDTALLDFAKNKGLIGRTWDAAIDYVKGVINSKKEHPIEINKDAFNVNTGEHYDSAVQNGREISRTYYKTDENGEKVVDEVIHLEYDDNGKIHRKIYMDANGNVKDVTIVSPDDETKILKRIVYDDNGQWEKQGFYEDGVLVKAVSIIRDVDMYGQKRYTQETYTKNGDEWLIHTEKGFDDVKFTPVK